MAEASRRYWIDWVKAIGMILIVWGHYNPDPLTPYVYGVSVPLFFFMSGYLSKPENSLREWWRKNLNGLVIPYFLLIGICTVISLPLNLWHLSLNKWIVYIVGTLTGFQSMRGISCAGTMWFVFTLFFVKLFFQLTSARKLLYCGFLVLMCVVAILYGWTPNSDRYVWAGATVPLAYPLYVLGHEWKKFDMERLLSSGWLVRLLCSVVALVLYALGCYFNDSPWMYKGEYGANWLLFMLTAFCGILVCCNVGYLLRNTGKSFAQTISIGSVIILAFHPIVMRLVSMISLPHWYGCESLLYSILVTLLFYPIIHFVSNRCPILMGGRKIP